MGRRALFTQEQVFDTADRLAAEGKEVTATTLLSALGGGSLTTIYRHFTAWQESRPASSGVSAPIEIPDPVQGAFATAWRVAASEAAREVTSVREKAAEEVKAAQRQFQEALQQIERLEGESEADAERIEAMTVKVSELEGVLHKAESEAAAQQATVEQLQKQAKAQEQELERLRKERDKAVTEAAELRGQVEALKDQNRELLASLSGAKKTK
jgi:DNA repair ATPase RecN